MELAGKTALVTGAARRIGKAISLALARQGADIAVHYRDCEADAAATAGEIRSLNRRAELFQADLSDPRQIDRLFEAVAATFGRLDVLVNNAAICRRTPIDSLTAEQWDGLFTINARAPALCIARGGPLMTAGGVIINIADVSALSPWAGYPAYCASKAAVVSLTRSSAKALAPTIRVNAVAPGVIRFPAESSDEHREDLFEGMADRKKRKVLDHIAMKRPGSPADVANAVVFLAGQDYITGQILHVDGGWKMGWT